MLIPEWECADGTTVRQGAMSTSHIVNARDYLLTGTGPNTRSVLSQAVVSGL